MSYTRYHLLAYVCGQTCVRWRSDMGSVTFPSIYIQRPKDCRYAVAERVDDKIVVWDLYNARYDPVGGFVTEPEPVRVHDDVDSAVMAAGLLYGEEDE